MTFGFPAYHERYILFDRNLDFHDIERILEETFYELNLSLCGKYKNKLKAKNGFNTWSLGEQIEVSIINKNKLHIRSQCVLVTQCFDWGQNERNVNRLTQKIMSKVLLYSST